MCPEIGLHLACSAYMYKEKSECYNDSIEKTAIYMILINKIGESNFEEAMNFS